MMVLYKKIKNYGIRKTIKFGLFESYRFLYLRICKQSYSLDGEDLIIDRLLKYKNNGFYIDVGANDHNRLSNTKIFYKRGWRGINIDVNPNAMRSFKNIDPRI